MREGERKREREGGVGWEEARGRGGEREVGWGGEENVPATLTYTTMYCVSYYRHYLYTIGYSNPKPTIIYSQEVLIVFSLVSAQMLPSSKKIITL